MKNYILITNQKTIKFGFIKEIMKYLLGNDYYVLSEEQKILRRYENAFNIKMILKSKMKIVHTLMGVFEDNYNIITGEYSIKDDFIIDTDITYLLSMCRFKQCMLFEEKNAKAIIYENMNIDTDNIQDNYIIINKYIDKLMVFHTLQKIN